MNHFQVSGDNCIDRIGLRKAFKKETLVVHLGNADLWLGLRPSPAYLQEAAASLPSLVERLHGLISVSKPGDGRLSSPVP